jgi:hypothetical protein
VEDALPALPKREHPVSAVPVQEERLEEDAQRPVTDEENHDRKG